jgi:hypothetical protein
MTTTMKTHFIFLVSLISSGLAYATSQATLNQDKPARLYVKSYNISDNGSANSELTNGFSNFNDPSGVVVTIDTLNFNGAIDWNSDSGGSLLWLTVSTDHTTSKSDYFPHDNWEFFSNAKESDSLYCTSGASGTLMQVGNSSFASPIYNYTNTYVGRPIPVLWEHCDINFSTNFTFYAAGPGHELAQERRVADTKIKLMTGGKAASKSRSLFRISAGATEMNPPTTQYAAYPGWMGTMSYMVYNQSSKTNIPAQSINIGSYGAANATGKQYFAFPGGADIEMTPHVAGVDYYSFGLGQYKIQTKADWQSVVADEIDADSGVKIENYQALNGFMNNRTNIQAVYAFYQKVFKEQPTWYYWSGLAKLAGAPVYAGLSDAQYVKDGAITSGFLTLDNLGAQIASALLSSKAGQFQTNLIQMNIDIYSDLAWQFEAYRKVGLDALETVNANDPNSLDIGSWRLVDQSIQQNSAASIQAGNQLLLQREQQKILALGYSSLSSLFPGTTSLMSILAKNPVLGGPSFSSLEPSGNIANFSDRWDWITRPYSNTVNTGMLPLWLHEPASARLQEVGQLLRTRALQYSIVYGINNSWTPY